MPAAAVGPRAGPWIMLPHQPGALTMAGLGPGQMLEVTTVDERGSVDGAALFAVRAAYPADGCG
eukprot:160297-Lingulodinium_polyedra.AAC.1